MFCSWRQLRCLGALVMFAGPDRVAVWGLRQTSRTDACVGALADGRLWRGGGLIAPDQSPVRHVISRSTRADWA